MNSIFAKPSHVWGSAEALRDRRRHGAGLLARVPAPRRLPACRQYIETCDLDHVLLRYAEHYNAQRPHRGRQLRTPAGVADREFIPDVPRMRRIDVLGGLICEYELAAA